MTRTDVQEHTTPRPRPARVGRLAVLALLVGLALVAAACGTAAHPPVSDAVGDLGDGDGGPVVAARAGDAWPARTVRGSVAEARPGYPDIAVVGHRGAPAFRPEHTLEGYRLAVEQGADYIEPDIVITRDGELITRHERDLTDSTDVRDHPELADRARDGRWYAEDLTLAEIRTLRATGGPPPHPGRFAVPSLRDVLELLRRLPRTVGAYIETKDPAYLRSIGLPVEERLAGLLREYGLDGPAAPVLVQSFDPQSLLTLRDLVDLRRVQLVRGSGYHCPITAEQLDAYAAYAGAIGVRVERLRGYLDTPPPDADNLVTMAAARGLEVHVYGLNGTNPYGALPASFSLPGDPPQWAEALPLYRALYSLGVAAVFTDTPNIAAYARG